MFISDDVFFEKLKKDSVQLFEKKGDDLFLSYLTTTRVLLYSAIMYGKTDLTLEEKEDFGLLKDVDKCFDSIDRSEHITAITYITANYTYTAYHQMISEAFDMSLIMYEKGYDGHDKSGVLKGFKKQKAKILKQYLEQLDEEKFMNLYEDLVEEHALTRPEKKSVLKDLKKKFKELIVWDIAYIKNEVERSVQNAKV